MRFLQISDLHLGSRFGWLPAERRAERRREQQRALEDAVALAIERGANAILIPGDLFHDDEADAETLAFAVHAFDVAGCPPVFVAPGNHDPWSETSPNWSDRLLRARGWAWPEHVHVFSTPAWTSRSLPDPRVRIWGRCSTSRVESWERPLDSASLEEVLASDATELHVALFHGSREGHCPPGQAITGPFSDEEVRRAPFAYMAVGHYHRHSRLESDGENSPACGARMAYAGSALALDPTEVGSHGSLEVRIFRDSAPPRVEVEFLELDRRRVHDLSLDVTGVSSADQIDRRVRQALDEAGVSDRDIATVRLTGRLVRGVRYSEPGAALGDRAFHLRIDLRKVRPDYDLDAYRRSDSASTEDRFVQSLLEKLDREQDPARRAVIESALYYGLDAFRLREVVPAYEELSE